MAVRIALNHKSVYLYDRPVRLSPQIVRLRPAPHCRTPVSAYSLRVLPQPHFLNWQQDPQGNFLARVVFPERVRHFSVTVDLVADMTIINPFDFFVEPQAENFPFPYEPWLERELAPFREASEPGPRLSEYLRNTDTSPRRTIDFLVHLNRKLQAEIRYLIRTEPGVQSSEETLERRSGSCRDTAWLLVEILRHLGLAARFVSGYLIQLKPDVKPLEGPEGPGQDFTDLHAWAEAYLPGAGWIGLDPTSGLLAGEGHIPLAATPDPPSAAPISGLVDECQVRFSHEMTLTRIQEDPRVTLPYTASQWQRIEVLGARVDADLLRDDVRLTMGGEPTFVSIDNMDGEEWNTAALGSEKRRLAAHLLDRLRDRFAPAGLLHYGQGKWYPGEPLPRWALTCFWRSDGIPLWRNRAFLANEDTPGSFNASHAQRFARAVAERLGLDPDYVSPAFEDPLYHLQKERQLPVNVDPVDNRLDDPEERERLRRVFERGLETPAGMVLPLQRHSGKNGPEWQTGLWMLRGRHVFLIPGDSPLGLRLPLPSLPWVEASEAPQFYPVDPMAIQSPLPVPPRNIPFAVPFTTPIMQRPTPPPGFSPCEASASGAQTEPRASASGSGPLPAGRGSVTEPRASASGPGPLPDGRGSVTEPRAPASGSGDEFSATANASFIERDRMPQPGESAPWIVRTALCVEPRAGRLHMFMPPLERAADYIDLLAAIEDTASRLEMPVVIEGYPPPPHPQLQQIKVTPDPGVLEVNIHPSRDWPELVTKTTALYEEARLTHLGTEKFMLDGRHTGTGGGNHFVLGGATPQDSPFLRRPDLLRSMLGYWLNHPSLSYVFSSIFIGPTSQAPRIDETRADSLYELEIAFGLIPEPGRECPPWLVDRIFRHLLTDVTGNTHRAEFCIDKLYSPDSATGRLGLLEMRGFEMPPHARMSLTQQLLVRALVAWFWREPYTQKPVHWGTRLHDQFMLPHFTARDFAGVLEDLNRAGYGFEAEWFAPHFEFRYPVFGSVHHAGMDLEIRQATEPWYVLGEEGAAGGTTRYVDSSVERVQVKAQGLTGDRYIVTCNGRRLPLHFTGKQDEWVAAVRYRAWQPPSCLHPTIPVHTPLTFDILDTWSGRSVGGCTYHVAHPAGRNFVTFPVNANEAEARRAARFYPFGHTPGPMPIPPRERNPEFPLTLDLRRPVVPEVSL